jgi:hypothetical protein
MMIEDRYLAAIKEHSCLDPGRHTTVALRYHQIASIIPNLDEFSSSSGAGKWVLLSAMLTTRTRPNLEIRSFRNSQLRALLAIAKM